MLALLDDGGVDANDWLWVDRAGIGGEPTDGDRLARMPDVELLVVVLWLSALTLLERSSVPAEGSNVSGCFDHSIWN